MSFSTTWEPPGFAPHCKCLVISLWLWIDYCGYSSSWSFTPTAFFLKWKSIWQVLFKFLGVWEGSRQEGWGLSSTREPGYTLISLPDVFPFLHISLLHTFLGDAALVQSLLVPFLHLHLHRILSTWWHLLQKNSYQPPWSVNTQERERLGPNFSDRPSLLWLFLFWLWAKEAACSLSGAPSSKTDLTHSFHWSSFFFSPFKISLESSSTACLFSRVQHSSHALSLPLCLPLHSLPPSLKGTNPIIRVAPSCFPEFNYYSKVLSPKNIALELEPCHTNCRVGGEHNTMQSLTVILAGVCNMD